MNIYSRTLVLVDSETFLGDYSSPVCSRNFVSCLINIPCQCHAVFSVTYICDPFFENYWPPKGSTVIHKFMGTPHFVTSSRDGFPLHFAESRKEVNENDSCDKKTYQTVIEMEQKQKENLEKSVAVLNQRNAAANAHPDPPHPHPHPHPPQSNATTERSHGRNSACGSILVPPNISSEYCQFGYN